MFVNDPLDMHPSAKALATAGICANSQGFFWEMREKLFQLQPKTEKDMSALLPQVPLNRADFEKCLKDEAAIGRQVIEKDLARTNSLGLKGTPSFAIGLADSNDRITVKKLMTGSLPLEAFQDALNDVMK